MSYSSPSESIDDVNECFRGYPLSLNPSCLYATLSAVGRITLNNKLSRTNHTPETNLGTIGCKLFALGAMAKASGSATFSRDSGSACPDTEARFMQSLVAVEEYCLPPTGCNAEIILDSRGHQPLAYKKNYGVHTTLVLTESEELGEIAPGTIITLNSGCVNKIDELPRQGLVVATLNPQCKLDAVIRRPTTFCLSPEERKLWEYDIEKNLYTTAINPLEFPSLPGSATKANDITIADFHNRTTAILERGKLSG